MTKWTPEPVTPYLVATVRASVRTPTCVGWAALNGPPALVADPVDGWALIHRGHRTATAPDPAPLLALIAAEAASPGYITDVILNTRLDPQTAALDPIARQDAINRARREQAAYREALEAAARAKAAPSLAKTVQSLDDLLDLPDA